MTHKCGWSKWIRGPFLTTKVAKVSWMAHLSSLWNCLRQCLMYCHKQNGHNISKSYRTICILHDSSKMFAQTREVKTLPQSTNDNFFSVFIIIIFFLLGHWSKTNAIMWKYSNHNMRDKQWVGGDGGGLKSGSWWKKEQGWGEGRRTTQKHYKLARINKSILKHCGLRTCLSWLKVLA